MSVGLVHPRRSGNNILNFPNFLGFLKDPYYLYVMLIIMCMLVISHPSYRNTQKRCYWHVTYWRIFWSLKIQLYISLHKHGITYISNIPNPNTKPAKSVSWLNTEFLIEVKNSGRIFRIFFWFGLALGYIMVLDITLVYIELYTSRVKKRVNNGVDT